MLSQGQVGLLSAGGSLADGTRPPLRQGRQADTIISALHPEYYETAFRGNVFLAPSASASSALSATTVALDATCTPIVGVHNPANSGVNVVLIQATCVITATANSAVAPGGFGWFKSTLNNFNVGFGAYNTKSLHLVTSKVYGLNQNTALTGLANNLSIYKPSNFPTLVAAQGATATPFMSSPGIEIFNGSMIIVPNTLVALLNTVSTTGVSVGASLMWEEVPI